MHGLTDKLTAATAKSTSLGAQLSDTVEAKRFIEGELEASQAELLALRASAPSADSTNTKEAEIEELHVMVVELKTELAFAQAALDGAYGSRAERAKEAAAVQASGDVARLHTQVRDLKAQLAQTADSLEAVTKETLAAERDRTALETKLDQALARREGLQQEADELRRRLEREEDEARRRIEALQDDVDSERLKGLAASSGTGTQGPGRRAGAAVLSEQFRATMREERKKFQEELRVSHFVCVCVCVCVWVWVCGRIVLMCVFFFSALRRSRARDEKSRSSWQSSD